MQKLQLLLFWFLLIFIFSCTTEDSSPDGETDSSSRGLTTFDGGSSGGGGGSGSGQGNDSGLITAGEWNDLDNWNFWQQIITHEDFKSMPSYWKFYPHNQIAVEVKNGDIPQPDVVVSISKNNKIIWKAKTDNLGRANLWISIFENSQQTNLKDYVLEVNGQKIATTIKKYSEGINKINITSKNNFNQVDLAFIVDATGSMYDELEFLKDDLQDVIQKVKSGNPVLTIKTAAVFYRDKDDEYLVRHSGFTNNINTTHSFIEMQEANGGGDFPEAVHDALELAIEQLQWSSNAKSRIAFLLLDAPPHHDQQIIAQIQKHVKQAAQKGIKIIPITASGIDKETEFLMRFFSIATNGTYVFITNDSGIGNDHLEPSVGEYKVEYLNDLMVRLIKKYTH